ncbi:response regulator [candidate division GN15 bacterium]|nr:response regulator [candidate division GN15 bacterium]
MSKARILFVDDEKDFVEVVAERLRGREIDVDTAFSGPEGIERVKAHEYDAILLDLAMPEMDGMETMKQMLAHDPKLQIIILTGEGSVSAGVEAMKHGATDFVEKPADIDTLVDKFSEAHQKRLETFEEDVSKKMSDLMRKKGW